MPSIKCPKCGERFGGYLDGLLDPTYESDQSSQGYTR